MPGINNPSHGQSTKQNPIAPNIPLTKQNTYKLSGNHPWGSKGGTQHAPGGRGWGSGGRRHSAGRAGWRGDTTRTPPGARARRRQASRGKDSRNRGETGPRASGSCLARFVRPTRLPLACAGVEGSQRDFPHRHLKASVLGRRSLQERPPDRDVRRLVAGDTDILRATLTYCCSLTNPSKTIRVPPPSAHPPKPIVPKPLPPGGYGGS